MEKLVSTNHIMKACGRNGDKVPRTFNVDTRWS